MIIVNKNEFENTINNKISIHISIKNEVKSFKTKQKPLK